jgi:hypothetical protein
MCNRLKKTLCNIMLALALLLGLAGPARAVDGVILIDQNKALTGSVTPGDAPDFPVTISQPGSYRLTGNLDLTKLSADTTAIEISTDNVTLDLNGFAILGPTVCSGFPPICNPVGTGEGVSALWQTNITVVNGTVRGMGLHGIEVGENSRVEKVHAISNRGSGIFAGEASIVSGNTAHNNGGGGMATSYGTMSGNTASHNYFYGIGAFYGSTVIGNTAYINYGYGLLADGSTGYANNVFTGNYGYGTNQQVDGGGIQMGTNICNYTTCP